MTNSKAVKSISALTAAVVAIVLTSCSALSREASSDIVVLPLGGEVKVTDGSIVYALPMTVFRINVKAEKTVEIPGPYAAFASEMLGIRDAIKAENEFWSLGEISLVSEEELDPAQFYIIQGTTLMQTNALALKKNGLIMDLNPEIYTHTGTSHVNDENEYPGLLFPDLGAKEYVSFKTDTAYKVVKADTAFIRVPYLVEKKKKPTTEEEASAAARRLLELREGKHMILTGETNIFPQDAASIDEINRLDREYTALFAGKRWTQTKVFTFWFVPETSAPGQEADIFRFSEVSGVLAAGDTQGQAVKIAMTPSDKTKDLNLVVRPVTSEKEMVTQDKLYYRVPDVVDIRIMMGDEILFTARKLVYQFGNTVALPSNFIIGK